MKALGNRYQTKSMRAHEECWKKTLTTMWREKQLDSKRMVEKETRKVPGKVCKVPTNWKKKKKT